MRRHCGAPRERGDGWIPLFLAPDEYSAALGRLDKEAERAGRDPATVTRAVVAFVSVGSPSDGERGLSWMASLYGLPARSFARHLVSGSARACAAALARFSEAGAQHVAVFVTSDDPLVQFEDLAVEFADLVASPAAAPDRPHTDGRGVPHGAPSSRLALVEGGPIPVGIQVEDPVRR